MRSITCANDDDDLRSEKLAVFREPAAPWQATPLGGPIQICMIIGSTYTRQLRQAGILYEWLYGRIRIAQTLIYG